MNRLISALLLALFAVTVLAAQPMRRTPEERTAQLKKELELNAKQEKQVLKIFTEADKEREEMFANMQESGDRDQARGKMMKLLEETDKKIEALLTKTQLKKYDDIKKERRERMKERRN
ncbi:MAG: hypothetical protein F9K22_13575 [Bacteroidetes bacterium]|nr:MAG: hypothetical protein F9K22_13575 [Bacteroidota bacterium]